MILFLVVVLVGEATFATNANHIQVANTATAMDLPGSASVIPIGVGYYAIKVSCIF